MWRFVRLVIYGLCPENGGRKEQKKEKNKEENAAMDWRKSNLLLEKRGWNDVQNDWTGSKYVDLEL